MNYSILNSNSLNSSTVQVIVGALAAGALLLSTAAEANIRVYGGSNVTLSTAVSAYGYQQHNAVCLAGSSAINGSTSAIRQGGYIPKTDFLNTTGNNVERFIYSWGGSSNVVNTSGNIAPNYFVAPDYTQDGVLDLSTEISPIRLKIATASSVVSSLSGFFVIPKVVTVGDLYVITSLDGYAIPANALGKGSDGELILTGSCNAIRTVVANAHVKLWDDGPKLVTNDAATLKHIGYLPTTGLTNVAIKENTHNYYTWYYEDWLTINAGTGSINEVVFKGAIIPNGTIGVTYSSVGVRIATARVDPIESLLIGSSLDPDRKAGLIALPGFTRLAGPAVVYDTIAPAGIVASLSTTGTCYAERRALGYSNGTITCSAPSLQQRTITPAVIGEGNLTTDAVSTGERRVLGYGSGSLNTDVVVVELVNKVSYATGNVNTVITTQANVMFTTQPVNLTTSGYGFARRIHVSEPSQIVTALADTGNDYRLAVRMNEISYWNTTEMELFDIVNLFARADETRRVDIPPSPFAGTTTLHYIEVTQ